MHLRNSTAILGILAVIFLAALVPTVAIVVVCAVAALVFPSIAVARCREIVVCDDQPVALRALVSFRAPPAVV